jgi:hypothetical protein
VKGFKYALLVLPIDAEPGELFELDETTVTLHGELADLIDPARIGYWKESVGTFEYGHLQGAHRLVVSRIPSARAEVLDDEHLALHSKMRALSLARAIVGAPLRWSLEGRLFSGKASDGDSRGTLEDIRHYSRELPLLSGYYNEREEYRKLVSPRGPRNWLTAWRKLAEDFERARTAPPLLAVLWQAYYFALLTTPLEHRLPDMVRVAECVLGLPNRAGRKEYASRAMRVCPDLGSDRYVNACGVNAQEQLGNAYQHRSDCLHGKIPFNELHAQGEQGKDSAALLDYLTEAVARGCLRLAFSLSDYEVLRTRDGLEAAWESGAFPPSG